MQFNPDIYDVVWTEPSLDSSGSMPLGNGDTGLNLWVEPSGDIVFYISKTDSWSETGRLLKLARVRISFTPAIPIGAGFVQALHLGQGEIEIRSGSLDQLDVIRIWVDANHPVICVEAELSRAASVNVSLENWRNKERVLEGKELESAYGLVDAPFPVVECADVISNDNNSITWYHRNPTSIVPLTLSLQGLNSISDTVDDPLLNRTFGGVITGEGMQRSGTHSLISANPACEHLIQIHILTDQTPASSEWLHRLCVRAQDTVAIPIATRRKNHRQWWDEFWNRSYIVVHGDDDAETVSRGYALQRFINACAGRGAYPIKFNGSIFTVDAREPNEEFNADYRRWGGAYWFQNTRLIYWPMLASGDFDLMLPLFAMYRKMLPFALARTSVYFGHEGAFFPETLYPWGAYVNDNYGWNREGKDASHVNNTYIRYYWQGGIELVAMMLAYYDYTREQAFLETTLLPIAEAVIDFYMQHYGRDDHGKIVMNPASSLETWQDVINPAPDIAGLRWIIDGLLRLPHEVVTEDRLAKLNRIMAELPEIPSGSSDGERYLTAAEQILGPLMNSENPELYAVFPYRLFGVSSHNDVGVLTFRKRLNSTNAGWTQDPIQAACLGLAHEAKTMVVDRFTSKHAGSRFPAFWGPNFDWIPDQDHCSVAAMALQCMLFDTSKEEIVPLPAWPKEWNVDFKLHAYGGIVVEGSYVDGELSLSK